MDGDNAVSVLELLSDIRLPQQLTESLSDQSFYAVAEDRFFGHLFAGNNGQPRVVKAVGQNTNQQKLAGRTFTEFVDPLDITGPSETEGTSKHRSYRLETVKRVRPLSRRRLRMFCPTKVFIRAKKPCFFIFRRTLRWRVRFMVTFPTDLLQV